MVRLTEAERARVDAAVAAAERETSGEIVTIVAAASDAYHDVALHWALLAALLVPALFAVVPGPLESLLAATANGWSESHPLPQVLLVVMGLMIAAFLAARAILAAPTLRVRLAPLSTRERRVRRRALACFRVGTERRTIARTGVLIYLSLAEHVAEIVADEAISAKVAPDTWGAAMAALIDGARAGRLADGLVDCVTQVGAVLATHSPPHPGNPNELPDRLIEL